MSRQLFDLIENFEFSKTCNTPSAVKGHWSSLVKAKKQFEKELDSQQTSREQMLFTLDVIEKLVLSCTDRSTQCELTKFTGNCDNQESYHVLQEWIQLARQRFEA